MAIALYMDVHIPKPITVGLRFRGVDVLTAQEDNADELSDCALLDRASLLGRVLFTFDDDLLAEAHKRQSQGIAFTGIIYIHLLNVSIGPCIQDLEIIAKAALPEDLANSVEFLPL
jgi:hypothetical protein